MFIERPRHLVYNKLRHAFVHFARQIDETRSLVERARLAGEVQWVDGDTVSAKTRPGIEPHEPIWPGGCRLDHVPDIYFQNIGDLRKFVRQADIYRAEGVLKELDEFGSFWRNNRYDLRYHSAIKCAYQERALLRYTTNNFGRILYGEGFVARINALRRKGKT